MALRGNNSKSTDGAKVSAQVFLDMTASKDLKVKEMVCQKLSYIGPKRRMIWTQLYTWNGLSRVHGVVI